VPLDLLSSLFVKLFVIFEEKVVIFFEQIVEEESKFLDGDGEVLRCHIDDIFTIGYNKELELPRKANKVINVTLLYHFRQIV
jgi:hypothetical protein